jgi:hypothetical protein
MNENPKLRKMIFYLHKFLRTQAAHASIMESPTGEELVVSVCAGFPSPAGVQEAIVFRDYPLDLFQQMHPKMFARMAYLQMAAGIRTGAHE